MLTMSPSTSARSPGIPCTISSFTLMHRAAGNGNRACGFTTNLAVLHYLTGRRDLAFAELERAASMVEREHSPGCRASLFHLGVLSAELGKEDDSRAAFRAYLDASVADRDSESVRRREIAARMLAR